MDDKPHLSQHLNLASPSGCPKYWATKYLIKRQTVSLPVSTSHLLYQLHILFKVLLSKLEVRERVGRYFNIFLISEPWVRH